jgi:ABC-2 type transport system ATP-binding protein
MSAGQAGPLAIEIAGLSKRYGKVAALDDVDLAVPEGSVFGFLGPNGAGKTTTLRVLAGLARPSAGQARIFGLDVAEAPDQVPALIGYLPDVPGFYGWMTAREFLALSGSLFGLSGAVLSERIDALLDLAGLTGVEARIAGYSRGMKQRLGVAQAMINAPRLLLLDEPPSALAPIGRRELLEMIAGLAGRTTVFFSTHILADVERVCESVAILARGRVVEQAGIDDLKSRHGGGHHLLVDVDDAEAFVRAIADARWLRGVTREERDLDLDVTDLDAAFRVCPRPLRRRAWPCAASRRPRSLWRTSSSTS